MKKKIKKESIVEGDNGASKELETVPEEPAADAGKMLPEQSNMEVEEDEGREEDSGDEKEVKNDESDEFTFPDTTISLTHLQPSR